MKMFHELCDVMNKINNFQIQYHHVVTFHSGYVTHIESLINVAMSKILHKNNIIQQSHHSLLTPISLVEC